MPTEQAAVRVVHKPWGVGDLQPWSNIDGSGDAIGELWFERADKAAPTPALLLKLLFTSGPLSIQVHPDDTFARAMGMPNGKSEAWYILAAQPDAQISTHASYYVDELATMVLGGKLDYVQVGVCGDAMPSAEYGLVWQTIAVDGICVLMRDDHPAAAGAEVHLAGLSAEQWVGSTGDSCFGDCFAAACARAGFTPRRMLETDIRGCVDMVESGLALALCQPTFRPPAGLTHRPLQGAPLRWRQVLGWHPDSPAARVAPLLMTMAGETYHEVVARNPLYIEWLEDYPQLGGAQLTAA
jgi:hypothetical protein